MRVRIARFGAIREAFIQGTLMSSLFPKPPTREEVRGERERVRVHAVTESLDVLRNLIDQGVLKRSEHIDQAQLDAIRMSVFEAMDACKVALETEDETRARMIAQQEAAADDAYSKVKE